MEQEGKAWDAKDCRISQGEKPVSKDEGWKRQQLGVTQTVESPVQAQGHYGLQVIHTLLKY